MAAACYLLGQKHYPVPYPVKSLAGYLVLAIVLVLAALYVPITGTLWQHAFRLGLCLAFGLLVLVIEKPAFRSRF
jgi:hypothetical protein